jgi:acyl carrier protein
MATMVVPDIGEVVEAIRSGVERRTGRKRKIYSAEDLMDDVGLSSDQFEDLISDLESRFGVVFDRDSLDQVTVAGALVVRLFRMCTREIAEEELELEVA